MDVFSFFLIFDACPGDITLQLFHCRNVTIRKCETINTRESFTFTFIVLCMDFMYMTSYRFIHSCYLIFIYVRWAPKICYSFFEGVNMNLQSTLNLVENASFFNETMIMVMINWYIIGNYYWVRAFPCVTFQIRIKTYPFKYV